MRWNQYKCVFISFNIEYGKLISKERRIHERKSYNGKTNRNIQTKACRRRKKNTDSSTQVSTEAVSEAQNTEPETSTQTGDAKRQLF